MWCGLIARPLAYCISSPFTKVQANIDDGAYVTGIVTMPKSSTSKLYLPVYPQRGHSSATAHPQRDSRGSLSLLFRLCVILHFELSRSSVPLLLLAGWATS